MNKVCDDIDRGLEVFRLEEGDYYGAPALALQVLHTLVCLGEAYIKLGDSAELERFNVLKNKVKEIRV